MATQIIKTGDTDVVVGDGMESVDSSCNPMPPSDSVIDIQYKLSHIDCSQVNASIACHLHYAGQTGEIFTVAAFEEIFKKQWWSNSTDQQSLYPVPDFRYPVGKTPDWWLYAETDHLIQVVIERPDNKINFSYIWYHKSRTAKSSTLNTTAVMMKFTSKSDHPCGQSLAVPPPMALPACRIITFPVPCTHLKDCFWNTEQLISVLS